MSLLRNLVDGSNRRPGSVVAPACLDLPAAWQREMAYLAEQPAETALASCWSHPENDRLAEHDGDFELQVRRWLCVSPLRRSLVPCR
jgi:hypothetical protein